MDSDTPEEQEVLASGRFLRLVRRGRWEYVERTRPVGAVFIGAITPEDALIVTEEYRVAVGAWVVGCPAGLVGDHQGSESEDLAEAASRELREEVGYEAASVRILTRGPTSAGQITEVITIALAEGLRKVGAGGGVEGERIRFQEIPLAEIDAWLAGREAEGRLIDPKVYTVLYFVRLQRGGPG